jgi:hypothetical protein
MARDVRSAAAVDTFRALTLVGVMALGPGCAKQPAPPAAVVPAPKVDAGGPLQATARPSAAVPKRFSDLLDDQAPVGYVPNEKADTPQCRAAFADFDQTWERASACERDDDCAIVLGTCGAARSSFKSALQQKLVAAGACVQMIALSHCLDTRAICFEKRCRVRGRLDKGN